jgi:hypothetical protein
MCADRKRKRTLGGDPASAKRVCIIHQDSSSEDFICLKDLKEPAIRFSKLHEIAEQRLSQFDDSVHKITEVCTNLELLLKLIVIFIKILTH